MQLTDDQFTRAMKALSEPNRLEILRLVAGMSCEGGVACTVILQKLDISQSTFSHHVTELREAELLVGEASGRSVLLTVNRPLMTQVQEKLKNLI